MVNADKKTLLEKYDLQIDQLDYKFIGNCKDVKTLGRILIVLRSGEEGVYPDLTKYCENRLREFAPKSKLLNCPKRILNFSELPDKERTEMEMDIESWLNETKQEERGKDGALKVNKELPPVRGKSVKIDMIKKEQKISHKETENKRSAQRSYSDWEKFDVEGELKKLDESKTSDDIKEKRKEIEKDSELPKLVSVSDLSERERQYVADLEKNKGNEAYKGQDYEEAVSYYSRSLQAFKSTTALNNRAQAYIKLRNYFAAIQDCTEVISLDSTNIKAMFRRGLAYKENGLYDLAKLDFMTILELDGQNKSAKEQLKQMKQLKFTEPKTKSVVIEEIKSDETEKPVDEKSDGIKGNETCTRMKIEEVSTTDHTVKLTNINYNSSDEDDDTSQLPEKVKEMFQINKPKISQNESRGTIRENEIEKKSVYEARRKEKKTKIVEEFKELPRDSNGQDRSTRQEKTSSSSSTCKSDSKLVNIHIEECIIKDNSQILHETKQKEKKTKIVEKFKESPSNSKGQDRNTGLEETPSSSTSCQLDSIFVEINERECILNDNNNQNCKELKVKKRKSEVGNSANKIVSDDNSTNVKTTETEYSSKVENAEEFKKLSRNSKAQDKNTCQEETPSSSTSCQLDSKFVEINEGECILNDNNNQNCKELKVKIRKSEVGNSANKIVSDDNSANVKTTETEYSSKVENAEEFKELPRYSKGQDKNTCQEETPSSSTSCQLDSKFVEINEGECILNDNNSQNCKELKVKIRKSKMGNSANKIADDNNSAKVKTTEAEYSSKVENAEKSKECSLTRVFKTTNIKNEIIGDDELTDADIYILDEDNCQKSKELKIKNKEFKNISSDFKTVNDGAKEQHIAECYSSNESHIANKFQGFDVKMGNGEHNYNTIQVKNAGENDTKKLCDKPVCELNSIVKEHAQNEKSKQESEKNDIDDIESNISSKCKIESPSKVLTEIENSQSTLHVSHHIENSTKDTSYVGRIKISANENLLKLEENKENIKNLKPGEALQKDIPYDKVTPYEFLHTWCSNNVEGDDKTVAEFLLKIKPEVLPSIISNKIDGSILGGLLRAIYVICKTGKNTDGENYLHYLTKVPRIGIAAMFLSEEEIQGIHNLFSTLENEQKLHMKYLNKILQI